MAGVAASGTRLLWGGSQLAATDMGSADAINCVPPHLVLGVLSDIHIFDEKQVPVFERALEFFRDRKADGVIIAGDMADRGLVDQLELVGKAWFKVFPENRRPDGQPIEKLFVYGNHDVQGHGYGDTPKKLAAKTMNTRKKMRLGSQWVDSQLKMSAVTPLPPTTHVIPMIRQIGTV